MQGDVIFLQDGHILTVRIRCDVDHHGVREMRERIDAMLTEARPELLILDFSQVDFMDSSGLGLILGRVERATATNTEVQLTGMSDRLKRLVRLSGIERVPHLSIAK